MMTFNILTKSMLLQLDIKTLHNKEATWQHFGSETINPAVPNMPIHVILAFSLCTGHDKSSKQLN